MKKIVFLAHDPGGYDVIKPIYDNFPDSRLEKIFYCAGPSGQINSLFNAKVDDIKNKIVKLIKENKLCALITGTSWGSTIEVENIEICNKAGILTISILDYWGNYKSRFYYRNNYIYPKFYIVMDQISKIEALKDGVPENIIYSLGHPGLQKYLERNPKENSYKESVEKVLLLSQPLSLLYGNDLGYNEKNFLEDCIDALNKLEIKFNIKFHPKETNNIKKIYEKHEIKGSLEEILYDYSIVVGMTTIGLLHAYLMGKKVISYQPNLKVEDACITNKLNMTKIILEKGQLYRELNQKINMKNCKIPKSCFFERKPIQKIVRFILGKINEENYE